MQTLGLSQQHRIPFWMFHPQESLKYITGQLLKTSIDPMISWYQTSTKIQIITRLTHLLLETESSWLRNQILYWLRPVKKHLDSRRIPLNLRLKNCCQVLDLKLTMEGDRHPILNWKTKLYRWILKNIVSANEQTSLWAGLWLQLCRRKRLVNASRQWSHSLLQELKSLMVTKVMDMVKTLTTEVYKIFQGAANNLPKEARPISSPRKRESWKWQKMRRTNLMIL